MLYYLPSHLRIYAFAKTEIGKSGPSGAAIAQFVGVRFSAEGGSAFSALPP